jgi:hypothetical protein
MHGGEASRFAARNKPGTPHPQACRVLGAIPLLFSCSAEKFPCSADLIPLFHGAAELMRKKLIYRVILGDESGFFRPLPVFFRKIPLQQGNSQRYQAQMTAIASTSIRNSGAAKAATATIVLAGSFLPKNSSRIGPQSARWRMSVT